MNPVRILLADDHNLVRAGIRSLIEHSSDYEVVGEAINGVQLLELAMTLKPDLIISDIAMPAMNGLIALRELHAQAPDMKVLILSMHATSEFILEALSHGASGYLLKDAAAIELDLAIKAILRGERYLSPQVADTLVTKMFNPQESSAPSKDNRLTARQVEILKLIASGKSIKEIAFDLDLSTKTVETHRAQIMERLEIRDIPNLVLYAVRSGLISVNP